VKKTSKLLAARRVPTKELTALPKPHSCWRGSSLPTPQNPATALSS